MNNPKLLLYNPDQKSKQQLIEEFVIRGKEYSIVMNGLLNSTLQTSPQHYLIVGQRGMGKTTLLLRVKYAMEDHPQLKNWLIPIRFSEEQYQIATLDRLWEEIAELLETANPLFKGLLQEMEENDEAEQYERIALEIMVKALKKHKKRVLVMVDNLGDLFKKFDEVENHRFREVLLYHTEIQLVGASSVMLEHTFRYDKPFFEFFQQIILQPIDKESAIKLLKKLGKQYRQEEAVNQLISENPAKIEILRRLTGGVPRTIALLFGIFIDHQEGTTFEDLQLLLDQVNSLYKARMDDMKDQQQQIVDALAKAWDPISAKEVLYKSKLDRKHIGSNQISAQLKVLIENQLVESISGPGKNKTYRIRERFFNIWYLMRYGKKQHREEVLWLVRFLETWCTTKELRLQAEEQLKALQHRNYSTQAAYFKTMALYHIKGIEASQKLQLLEQAETYLKVASEEDNAQAIGRTKRRELDRWVSEILGILEVNEKISLDDILTLAPESQVYIINSVAYKLFELNKPLIIIKELLSIGVQLGDTYCMNLMGIAYQNIDLIEAEKYYLMASELGDVSAMFNLGLFYKNEKKNLELAEKYYLMASERGNARAMFNLGIFYQSEKQNIELAEKYYLMAVEKNNASAMNNLAILYSNMGKEEQLIERYFRQAHTLGIIQSSFNLLLFYSMENRTKEMLALCLEILNKGDVFKDEKLIFQLLYPILEKKQYHFLLQQFKNPEWQLMKYARPFYYVLAWFMKDELPGEYEKAGSEIKETVDEIIQHILEEQKESEMKQKEYI